jgi:ATP-dependent RNA helicase DDX52/ROK1
MMALLGVPAKSLETKSASSGVRALVVAPTRELAHQIHNGCLELAQGRKWRIVLFSKATASTLADRNVRTKVGTCNTRDDGRPYLCLPHITPVQT